MSEETWEVAGEVSGELQAEILRGLLESHGIDVWISQEGAGRVYQLGVGKLGKVQLLVHSSKLQPAKEILQRYYAGEFEAGDEDESGPSTEVGQE